MIVDEYVEILRLMKKKKVTFDDIPSNLPRKNITFSQWKDIVEVVAESVSKIREIEKQLKKDLKNITKPI